MKIRWKTLWLLVPMALVPAILIMAINRVVLQNTQTQVANKAYESVSKNAEESLVTIVSDFGDEFNQTIMMLRLTLEHQVNLISELMEESPVATTQPVYIFGQDKDIPDDAQIFYMAADSNQDTARQQMQKLAPLCEKLKRLKNISNNAIISQYVAFNSGLHCSFPAKGKQFPDDFDPRRRAWFKKARELKGTRWLLMDDVVTCNYVITTVAPITDKNGKFIGATCLDINIEKMLSTLKLPESWADHAQVMLGKLTEEGDNKKIDIVLHNCRVRKLLIRDSRELNALIKNNPEEYKQLASAIASGKPGVMTMPFYGQQCLWAYGPQGPGGAFPLVILPKNIVIADAKSAMALIQDSTHKTLRYSANVIIPLLLVVLLVAWLSSRLVTRPIEKLVDGAHQIANGNFNAKVQLKSKDEFSRLAQVFNEIGPKLHEREQLKHSLFLASEIQHSLLPESSPKIDGFDVYGRSDYCDETGGDYFDFIPLADGEYGVTIGDITGHGIGAALLMATARAVIRSHAFHNDLPLGDMFEDINMHLVHDTGDARFMTLFFAVLNPRDRSMKWVSCGHDPAMLLRKDSDAIQELDNLDLLLGVIDDVKYTECGPINFDSDDILVIGTDGIWEARNVSGEMFGKDRMMQIIIAGRDKAAREIHHDIVQGVKDFCGLAAPEDDITLTVIKAV